jgi:hypothetical protein
MGFPLPAFSASLVSLGELYQHGRDALEQLFGAAVGVVIG